MLGQVAASASTFAAWPSALTEYQAWRIFPFAPMRNVDRITPTVCLAVEGLGPVRAVGDHRDVLGIREKPDLEPVLAT